MSTITTCGRMELNFLRNPDSYHLTASGKSIAAILNDDRFRQNYNVIIMLIHQRKFNVTTKNSSKRKFHIMNNYNQHDLLM
jgi:hypothetical protein